MPFSGLERALTPPTPCNTVVSLYDLSAGACVSDHPFGPVNLVLLIIKGNECVEECAACVACNKREHIMRILNFPLCE